MKCGRIPDSDSLFRQTIYPLAFRSGHRYAREKLLKLDYDQSNGRLLGSLTWERYVPTTELVHGYGCRLAFRMNEGQKATGKLKENNRRIYCGAYELKAKVIRALSSFDQMDEILSADVVHHVEDGEIAHTDLRIILRPEKVSSIDGTKTAIVDRLWNGCAGPLAHICDCDQSIQEHPNTSLPTAPTGAYSDTRSYWLRLWCVIRFHICSWAWRNKL